MLTQLSTVKSRLAIIDSQYDDLLTTAIEALSSRFDLETNRNLARTENATHEFDPRDQDLMPPCYPIESVSKFELKQNETDGFVEQTGIKYLIRQGCIISLPAPCSLLPASSPAICRLTYTGGFVLPGTTPDPGQTPLPADIEQAAVEQVAFWFLNRDKLGLKTSWPSGGEYRGFATQDLLPSVSAVLAHHRRFSF
jgi:hypothetical protein